MGVFLGWSLLEAEGLSDRSKRGDIRRRPRLSFISFFYLVFGISISLSFLILSLGSVSARINSLDSRFFLFFLVLRRIVTIYELVYILFRPE